MEVEVYDGALYIIDDVMVIQVKPPVRLGVLAKALVSLGDEWPEKKAVGGGLINVETFWDDSVEPKQFIAKVGIWVLRFDWTMDVPSPREVARLVRLANEKLSRKTYKGKVRSKSR